MTALLVGSTFPGSTSEWNAIFNANPSLWQIGTTPGLPLMPGPLATARSIEAIAVPWLSTQSGWPDGKYHAADVTAFGNWLKAQTNLAGKPQMSLLRALLEPWNKNWHGPDTAAAHRAWYSMLASDIRATGAGPDQVVLTQDFFPSGCAPEDAPDWFPAEAQVIGLDIYLNKHLKKGTVENHILRAVVKEALYRKLPIVVLESGIADGVANSQLAIEFIDRLCDFVEEFCVAWCFGSYDWSKEPELAVNGWKDGTVSKSPAVLAHMQQRVAGMKLLPAPYTFGTVTQTQAAFAAGSKA